MSARHCSRGSTLEPAGRTRRGRHPQRASPRRHGGNAIHRSHGHLQVSVTQAPEKGKANRAIIALLADELGLRKSQFELVAGETSPQKRFLVREITRDAWPRKSPPRQRARGMHRGGGEPQRTPRSRRGSEGRKKRNRKLVAIVFGLPHKTWGRSFRLPGVLPKFFSSLSSVFSVPSVANCSEKRLLQRDKRHLVNRRPAGRRGVVLLPAGLAVRGHTLATR